MLTLITIIWLSSSVLAYILIHVERKLRIKIFNKESLLYPVWTNGLRLRAIFICLLVPIIGILSALDGICKMLWLLKKQRNKPSKLKAKIITWLNKEANW